MDLKSPSHLKHFICRLSLSPKSLSPAVSLSAHHLNSASFVHPRCTSAASHPFFLIRQPLAATTPSLLFSTQHHCRRCHTQQELLLLAQPPRDRLAYLSLISSPSLVLACKTRHHRRQCCDEAGAAAVAVQLKPPASSVSLARFHAVTSSHRHSVSVTLFLSVGALQLIVHPSSAVFHHASNAANSVSHLCRRSRCRAASAESTAASPPSSLSNHAAAPAIITPRDSAYSEVEPSSPPLRCPPLRPASLPCNSPLSLVSPYQNQPQTLI